MDNAKTIKLKELKKPLEKEAKKIDRSTHWLIRDILTKWLKGKK